MSNLYENERYEVVCSIGTDLLILGEDGKYSDRPGYAVINKETGVVEHTTTVLPQALFQADAFLGALGSLVSQGASGNDETIIDGDADVIVIPDDEDPTVQ